MPTRLLVTCVVLSAAVAAGCGGAGTPVETRSDAASTRRSVPVSELRARAVEALLSAAATNDEPGMWAALSRPSRRRLGPTLADFRAGGARGVRASFAPFELGSHRVIVNETVDAELGVVAIEGSRALADGREYDALAVPVRLEGGTWKVEVDPAFTIEAVRPLRADRVRVRTQLFAEVAAPRRIDKAAMWFDGVPFNARGYWSPDRRRMSVWGEAPQPLRKGRHTVVAYAGADPEATANAWLFTVTVAGNEPPPTG